MEEDELERTAESIINAIANAFGPIRLGDWAVLPLRLEEVVNLLCFGVKCGLETNRVYVDTHQNSHEHNILCTCSSRLERGLNLVLACSPSWALFACVCVCVCVCVCAQRNNLSQCESTASVTLIMFVMYSLIKVEINLLNNVNLTDCFTSTLTLCCLQEETKEIVVDFRRVHTQHAPLTINGATVERVSSTKFLGVHITEDLSWTNNTAALAKKAQQRLYFLRKLRRARAPAPIMCTFYRGTIESILTSCITVWYGACNASCRKSLQRIVRAAEKIVGVSLPSLQDIYSTRLTRKALYIAGDTTHPTHSFFSLLPSGRRLRSLQARTNRLKDSFIHQAVRKLNSLPSLPPPPLSYTTHHWTLAPPHTTHTHTHTHCDKH